MQGIEVRSDENPQNDKHTSWQANDSEEEELNKVPTETET